jgi:uncharacterized protein YdhG (YjbR/CyaY superfamily)
MKTVTEYIAAQPTTARSVLRQLRAIIRKAAPRAVESISYGMPTYKLNGRRLIYIAGWARHCALYPGTIKVPHGKPVPAKQIQALIKSRAQRIAATPKPAPRPRRSR